MQALSNAGNMHTTYENNASLSKAIYLFYNISYLYFFMPMPQLPCLVSHGVLPLSLPCINNDHAFVLSCISAATSSSKLISTTFLQTLPQKHQYHLEAT